MIQNFFPISKKNFIKKFILINKNIILIIEEDDEEDKSNKPIAMVLKSTDLSINCSISGYLKDKLSTVEEILFLKYPSLKGKELIFIYNGEKLSKSTTLEETKIRNGSSIFVLII